METTAMPLEQENDGIQQTNQSNSADNKMGAPEGQTWYWLNLTKIAKPLQLDCINPIFVGYAAQLWAFGKMFLMGIDVPGRLAAYVSSDGLNWSSFYLSGPGIIPGNGPLLVSTVLGATYLNNDTSLPVCFVTDIQGTIWCCYLKSGENASWTWYAITDTSDPQFKIVTPMGILLIGNKTTVFGLDGLNNLLAISNNGGVEDWLFDAPYIYPNAEALNKSYGTATIGTVSGVFGLNENMQLQFAYTS